jgi:hypothetical protein
MKKAQAWGFDLMIASVLFVFGIIVFFLYSINSSQGEIEKLEDLQYEGNIIADDIMSEGFPKDWGTNTVTKIGILSDNKINGTKLERFYDLASVEYKKSKTLFNTKYEYFVNISEPMMAHGSVIKGIGNQSQNHKNLIKITRFTIYNNKPTTLTVEIWE